MKKLIPLLLLSLFLSNCKKNTSGDITPNEQEQTEQPDTLTGPEPTEHMVVEGVRYDNQRVSIPNDPERDYLTTLLVTLVDTIYKIPSGNIEWSILVPEKDSINAQWEVTSGIELKLFNNKKWIYKEQMWRHTFVAEIDKVTKSGSAEIKINLINYTKNETITRSIKVNVNLHEEKSEYNGAYFGMSKPEAIAAIQGYFKSKSGYAPEWDELIPNVGYLPFGKFYGRATTYEFEDNKLKRITEPGHWVSHPDSILRVSKSTILGLIDRFQGNVVPEFTDHGFYRGYSLNEPVSWYYNGLKISFETRKYVYDGVEGKATALVFEKAE